MNVMAFNSSADFEAWPDDAPVQVHFRGGKGLVADRSVQAEAIGEIVRRSGEVLQQDWLQGVDAVVRKRDLAALFGIRDVGVITGTLIDSFDKPFPLRTNPAFKGFVRRRRDREASRNTAD
jgi:hypothetical protein